MSHGWQGEKVRLVPLDRARHLENSLRWINDPEVTAHTLLGDKPMGRLAEEEFFAQQEKGDPHSVVFAIETHAGEHIGLSGLHRIEPRHGVASTGSLIGPREMWGRGHGTDSVRVRTRYAFEVLNLRLLLSNVHAGNERSHRMLLRAGYEECGRIPQRYWKRGRYEDSILLMLSRAKWEAMK